MGRKIISGDPLQPGYTYELTTKEGDHEEGFSPELTPKQMLALGVFDGDYFQGRNYDEFPKDWFKEAKLSPGNPNPELNLFGVHASKPLEYWQAKGWIHEDDPRGWFQWYCRYHLGRRGPDDERQIRRWRQMRRHVAQVQKNCPKKMLNCRPRQRQALLHWAYDSRKL